MDQNRQKPSPASKAIPRAIHQMMSPTYLFAGGSMKVHLTGAQTGGAFCMLESLMPPGHVTPLHVHQQEDEAFLILDGELDVLVGKEAFTVRAGEVALAPRGVPHQLLNTSGRPVRAIVLSNSPGFGDFVMAAGVPANGDAPPPPPAPEQLAATAARFGIEIAA
jgi:mannose-6-phosphate isomerase-like protein (cupin superfamily)